MRIEKYDMDGNGEIDHEVYEMEPGREAVTGMPQTRDYWGAVTDVACPVEDCDQTVVWYEAGYVPGYRVCMAPTSELGRFYAETLRHRFLASGDASAPTLIRD